MTLNVTLGDIINLAVLLLALLSLHTKNVQRITRIETKLNVVYDHLFRKRLSSGQAEIRDPERGEE